MGRCSAQESGTLGGHDLECDLEEEFHREGGARTTQGAEVMMIIKPGIGCGSCY